MNTVDTKPKPKRASPQGPRIRAGTPPARQIAAAILDVLAGGRTPGQAAEALGLSLPRYYALESRALDGLVKACEPRPKGRTVPPDRELAELRKQVDRLKHECERKQALARAAQRAVGLAAPAPKPAKRKRRPTVRALKAAAVLRSDPVAAPPQEVTPPAP